MIVALACDHAGFALTPRLRIAITAAGHTILELGTDSTAPVDYPDYALKLGEAVRGGRAGRGVLVCGSGVGATVAVNKIPGIRAGLCHDSFSARQGVEDDDCNVICLGARVIGPELAAEVVRIFLEASFSGAERHRRRVGKIVALETRRWD